MRRLFNLAERRSFCAPIGSLVIFALQEGSSSSLRLQLAAEALCREALEALGTGAVHARYRRAAHG